MKRLRMGVLLLALACVAVGTYLAQPRTKLVMVGGHLCEFYETLYDNGHPRERYYLIHAEPNAVRHGVDRSWFENGVLLAEVNQVYGRFEGRTRTWWPSGNPQWEAHFEEGVPHGSVRQWYDSGQLRTERFFQGGLCEGEGRVWDEKGTLRTEFTARGSHYHGRRRVWAETGEIRADQHYDNGAFVGEWTIWDEAGIIVAKGTYLDGEQCSGTFGVLDPVTEDKVVIDVELGVVIAVLPSSYGDALPHQFASTVTRNNNTKVPIL